MSVYKLQKKLYKNINVQFFGAYRQFFPKKSGPYKRTNCGPYKRTMFIRSKKLSVYKVEKVFSNSGVNNFITHLKTVLNRSLDYISHIIFNMTDVAQMVEKLKLLVSMAGHNRQILNEIFKTDSWNEARVIKLRIRAYPGKFKKLKEMKISIKSRH